MVRRAPILCHCFPKTNSSAIPWGDSGTIRIRPVRAFGLKKVQRFGEQDPYVKCTLLQTRKHLKTKYVNNGGQNCSWDPVQHNSVLDFDYDGMLASVGFKVEVLDAETIAADRLIGKNDDFIVNLPDAKSISKEHTVLLKDKKGNDAGRVTLEVFESKEVSSSHYASGAASNPLVTADPDLKTGATLTVQPIKGMDLKSVQRFGKQDPYCKVILQWNGVHQKTKYHNNGGKSPVWDEKEHDSKLSFATKLLPLDSKLTIEVYDAETIMPDRIIGTGALDLSRAVAEPATEHIVDVEMQDGKGKPAGTVQVLVRYLPDDFFQKSGAASKIQARIRGRAARKKSSVMKMPAGTLRLRPVRGIDLKSVQRIGKQDPYVKIRLLPGRVEKKTKYVNNGGKCWDPQRTALS